MCFICNLCNLIYLTAVSGRRSSSRNGYVSPRPGTDSVHHHHSNIPHHHSNIPHHHSNGASPSPTGEDHSSDSGRPGSGIIHPDGKIILLIHYCLICHKKSDCFLVFNNGISSYCSGSGFDCVPFINMLYGAGHNIQLK